MTSNPEEVTRLLDAASNGDEKAILALWREAQTELRAMATAILSRERKTANLQTTVVVNEAYIRMHAPGSVAPQWENREHFFGFVWRVMRQFMVDYARTRGRQKRGADCRRVPFEIAAGSLSDLATSGDSISDLLEALDRFSVSDPRQHEVLWRRMALDQSVQATAENMDISERTVAEDWRYAKAWLRKELSVGRSGP
ncbi:MAG: ECF-type sigma factor [Phycisphaerales bacterium]|nr:ECF-type sigma factor [Phycisphaerales bacterium]